MNLMTALHNKKMSYIATTVPKITKTKFDKKNSFVFKKKDYFKSLIKLIEFSGFPQRWGGGVPMSHCTKRFKDLNIKTIMSGDGLDEFLGGYQNKLNLKFSKAAKYYFPKFLSYNDDSIFYDRSIKQKFVKHITKLRNQSYLKFKNLKNQNYNEYLFKCFQHEFTCFFLQSVTLIQSDEYSMINSTEIRSPFVNKELFKIL